MSLTTRRSRIPTRVKAECFACQNRERSAWCGLSTLDLDLLNRQKQTSLYRAGQPVYQQGDECRGLFVVEAGTVAVRKTDSQGHTMLLRLCHVGDVLGYRAFLAGQRHATSAEALAESRICFFEQRAVQDMLKQNPELGLRFVRQLDHDLESTEQGLLRTAALPIRARLAHMLLTLKDRYGSVDEEGTLSLLLPLSRQDIASLLAARPETIARCIHELESDGVVRFAGRSAIIPDLDLLLDEVEFSDG